MPSPVQPGGPAACDAAPARCRPRPPCWRDVVLPSPWPGIVLTAGFFWLIFLAAMARLSGDMQGLWTVLVLAAIPLGVLPAVYAARRLSSCARLMALREEFGIAGGVGENAMAIRRAALKGLLRTFAVPLAVFALLAPIYVLTALITVEPPHMILPGHRWVQTSLEEHLWTSLALALDGALCVCASAAWGATEADTRRAGAGRRALGVSLVLAMLRAITTGAAVISLHFLGFYNVLTGPPGDLKDVQTIACADAALCVLCWLFSTPGVLGKLRAMLGARPGPPPDATPTKLPPDPEMLAGAGLDVSAWSLLYWRFWRDPLVRAERRHFWSTRRVVLLWVVLPFVLAGISVAALLIFNLPGYPKPLAFLWDLPEACLPTFFMAALVHGEKNGAVLESLFVAPITPLRLVATKLLGKAWHLLLALVVLFPIVAFIGFRAMLAWRYQLGWEPCLQEFEAIPRWMLSRAGYYVMFASVGLFFALRQRTLPTTTCFSLITALALLFGVSLMFKAFAEMHRGVCSAWLVTAAQVILYLALTGLFLAGAARHLVLRREETGGSAAP